MHNKKTHGGARKGAGRRSKNPLPTVTKTVKLDAQTIEHATVLGEGDLSYGLCLAVETVREKIILDIQGEGK